MLKEKEIVVKNEKIWMYFEELASSLQEGDVIKHVVADTDLKEC